MIDARGAFEVTAYQKVPSWTKPEMIDARGAFEVTAYQGVKNIK